MLHRVMGLVNVPEGPVLQSAGIGIVFLLGDVVMGLVQKLQCPMEAPSAVQVGIDGVKL